MDINHRSNYPQFIEHSFRRLSILIHQQDQSTSHTNDLSITSPTNCSNNSNEQKTNFESSSRTNRTYMRPPKRNTLTKQSCEVSHQSTDCLNPSMNDSSEKHSNELPIRMPYEQTPYDVRFEKDRQNDVREKFNIPPPFQRKWLRQPRYVPQERPVFGQIKQFQNE